MCILLYKCIQCYRCVTARWIPLDHQFKPCDFDYTNAQPDALCPNLEIDKIDSRATYELCTQCIISNDKKRARKQHFADFMVKTWPYEDRVCQTKIRLEQQLLRLRNKNDYERDIADETREDDKGELSLWTDILERYEESQINKTGSDDAEPTNEVGILNDEAEIEHEYGSRIKLLKTKLNLM